MAEKLAEPVKARGQLRHCFWGEYAATIALVFESKEDRDAAQKILSTHWEDPDNPRALTFHGGNPELEEVLKELESFGADRDDITSLKISVDYGLPFDVTIH